MTPRSLPRPQTQLLTELFNKFDFFFLLFIPHESVKSAVTQGNIPCRGGGVEKCEACG